MAGQEGFEPPTAEQSGKRPPRRCPITLPDLTRREGEVYTCLDTGPAGQPVMEVVSSRTLPAVFATGKAVKPGQSEIRKTIDYYDTFFTKLRITALSCPYKTISVDRLDDPVIHFRVNAIYYVLELRHLRES